MSDLDPLLAFALTALVIEITPGPNMTYLAALSLSGGMRTGLAAVAGIALGLMTYGVIAALGLAAAIDNSPALYGLLRWSGVAYLLWLAWEAWSGERDVSPEAPDGPDGRPWVAFRRGLITNLLNPKAAVFYVAVLPGFVRAGDGPVITQTLAAQRDLCGDRNVDSRVHRRARRLAAIDHRCWQQSHQDTACVRAGTGRDRDLVCVLDRPVALNCPPSNCAMAAP